LLTGHSHQAWPDVALNGVRAAFDDAAAWVDGKWERAFEVADRVRQGFAMLLDDAAGSYALGSNTHELVVRLLSALPLGRRRRLVTTDGEFHTLRRQLARLEEEGLTVVRLSAAEPDDLGERLAAEVARAPDATAAVLVSTVLFQSGRVVGGLGELAATCQRCGVALVLDVYHQLDAVPMSLRAAGLDGAFVVGGGYKYCQLGEGNCFLRVPPGTDLRPAITGWYAEFARLAAAAEGEVGYGRGAEAFAGATYDPTSHYRAAAVFDFHAEAGLQPELLRAVSQFQVDLLRREIAALDLDPARLAVDLAVPLEHLGGFLALRSPHAGAYSRALASRGVATDYRGDVLRLGPAPYLSPTQLRAAVAILGEVVRAPDGADDDA
jgi:kynureninase